MHNNRTLFPASPVADTAASGPDPIGIMNQETTSGGTP